MTFVKYWIITGMSARQIQVHDRYQHSLILPGTVISCSLPDGGCVEEGQTVTVTCVRSLDLTLQSTIISVESQDGTAVGKNSLIR